MIAEFGQKRPFDLDGHRLVQLGIEFFETDWIASRLHFAEPPIERAFARSRDLNVILQPVAATLADIERPALHIEIGMSKMSRASPVIW